MINSAFVQQCCKDIRKKIQRQDGFLKMETARLLEIAQNVYANRETEEEKIHKQNVTMAALIRGEEIKGRGRGRERGRGGRGRGTGGTQAPLGINQYAWCRGFGHWRRECPQGEEEGQEGQYNQMFQTEED